jgi:hypothetical protein
MIGTSPRRDVFAYGIIYGSVTFGTVGYGSVGYGSVGYRDRETSMADNNEPYTPPTREAFLADLADAIGLHETRKDEERKAREAQEAADTPPKGRTTLAERIMGQG